MFVRKGFLVVLGVGLFMLASLAVNATIAAAGSRFVWLLSIPPGLVQFADSLLSFALIAFVFGVDDSAERDQERSERKDGHEARHGLSSRWRNIRHSDSH